MGLRDIVYNVEEEEGGASQNVSTSSGFMKEALHASWINYVACCSMQLGEIELFRYISSHLNEFGGNSIQQSARRNSMRHVEVNRKVLNPLDQGSQHTVEGDRRRSSGSDTNQSSQTLEFRNRMLYSKNSSVSDDGTVGEEDADINPGQNTGSFGARSFVDKYINAFVMILSFSHVTLSLTLFELVDCTAQPGLAYSTLDVNQSIECDSPEHKKLLMVFWIFFFVYIFGIPFVIFMLLRENVIKPGNRNTRMSRIRYGYFYAKYKHDAYWWELIFMTRKLSVPTIKMFTDSTVVLVQISGAFLLFLFFAILHSWWEPFIEEVCNIKT